MFNISAGMERGFQELPKPRATPADLARIEASLGVTLPRHYVDFVSQYGYVVFGRDPEGVCAFSYAIERAGQREIREGDISFLFQPQALIDANRTMTSSDGPDDETRPMIPPGYVAVAGDAGQGAILLSVSANAGQVWYWRESNWRWGTEDNLALGFVAEDFEQFINGLRSDRGA